jgi:hypothetical protein
MTRLPSAKPRPIGGGLHDWAQACPRRAASAMGLAFATEPLLFMAISVADVCGDYLLSRFERSHRTREHPGVAPWSPGMGVPAAQVRTAAPGPFTLAVNGARIVADSGRRRALPHRGRRRSRPCPRARRRSGNSRRGQSRLPDQRGRLPRSAPAERAPRPTAGGSDHPAHRRTRVHPRRLDHRPAARPALGFNRISDSYMK